MDSSIKKDAIKWLCAWGDMAIFLLIAIGNL